MDRSMEKEENKTKKKKRKEKKEWQRITSLVLSNTFWSVKTTRKLCIQKKKKSREGWPSLAWSPYLSVSLNRRKISPSHFTVRVSYACCWKMNQKRRIREKGTFAPCIPCPRYAVPNKLNTDLTIPPPTSSLLGPPPRAGLYCHFISPTDLYCLHRRERVYWKSWLKACSSTGVVFDKENEE